MAQAALTATAGRLSPVRRLQLLALLGTLIAWEVLAASGIVYKGVVPSTVVIAGALLNLFLAPSFWWNAGVSLFEIVSAIAVGSALGILAGIVIGQSRLLAAATEPLINAIASTPKVIFLPIFYLLFGIGSGSKIAVGALGCFLPVAVSVIVGMNEINPTLVRVGRSFRLSPWQMATKIYLPSLVGAVANGLRIGASAAIAICLVAETRFSYAGLGFMVIDAYNRGRFPQVYAVIAIIVALAATANALIARIDRPS